MNQWLFSIGITSEEIRDHFLYSALVDYFPGSINGSHKIPTREDIANEREKLVKAIVNFDPKIIVPVGRLSISYCLGVNTQPLSDTVGKIYQTNPYLSMEKEITVIPLPHPSGASTWKYKSRNKELLYKALKLLKENII